MSFIRHTTCGGLLLGVRWTWLVLLLASWPAGLWAQYTISTVAGGAPPPSPVVALSAAIGRVRGVAVDPSGNYYFSSSLHCVFKVDREGIMSRVAGTCRQGYSGDLGPALDAQLNAPFGLAVDTSGNLYVADEGNCVIRKVTPDGTISTVAGDGIPGFAGDDGPATSAMLDWPAGVAVDTGGNLYIADRGNGRIRKVTAAGVITTLAGKGDGSWAFSGDGGPATSANLSWPYGVAVDPAGNVYVADTGNYRVRRVATNGVITTVAGNGRLGFSGDGGPAVATSIELPRAVAVDSNGNLYIADIQARRVRKVSANGIISTVAGGGVQGFSGDGGPATAANLSPAGVAVDGSNNLYVTDETRIRRVSANGIISTVAGNGKVSHWGDGGAAQAAQLAGPRGVALDGEGNVYIADTLNHCVRKVSSAGTITTIAGTGEAGFSGDGGAAADAKLNEPWGVAADAYGNVFIADRNNHRVRKVSAAGSITTVAGTGYASFPGGVGPGDGGPATAARVGWPSALALDSYGNLYIAEGRETSVASRIRRIGTDGLISTVAGTGTRGYSGDGLATDVQLAIPTALAVDAEGNLYVADSYNNRIRKISTSGMMTTIAGTGNRGYEGNGGPAVNANMDRPSGLAIDAAGNIYVSDPSSGFVRKIGTDGVITAIAGTYSQGYSGDGGPAFGAQLNTPWGLAVDSQGGVYVADSGNNVIRLLQPGDRLPLVVGVTNAATNRPGPVAPGELVVLWGANMGPAQLANAEANLTNQLAETRVLFNDVPAAVFFSSAGQVAAVVPYGIRDDVATVQVEYKGRLGPPFQVGVTEAAPGIFTADSSGRGQAAALNEDGSMNGSGNPARAGSAIVLYATGEGSTALPGVDNKLLPVSVRIGGGAAAVEYAGAASGQIPGLLEIKARIPGDLGLDGPVVVTLSVGDATSPGDVVVTVASGLSLSNR